MKNRFTKVLKVAVSFVFVVWTLSFSAAAQDSLAVKKYTYTPQKFERKMQRRHVQVLDVRTEKEYNEGHRPGALLIDVQQPDFTEKMQQLDKNKTYLIYCRSGRRSEKALKLLHKGGFSKTYHLKGGYLNWKGEKTQ